MVFNQQKRSWQSWINRLLHPPGESPDYRAWKQKLFRDRLKICFWIILLCCIIFAIKDFAEVYNPEFSQKVIENLGRERIELYRNRTIYPYSTIAIIWLICLYRLRKDNFRQHTKTIFLALA